MYLAEDLEDLLVVLPQASFVLSLGGRKNLSAKPMAISLAWGTPHYNMSKFILF